MLNRFGTVDDDKEKTLKNDNHSFMMLYRWKGVQ